jgi:hypothetical protein
LFLHVHGVCNREGKGRVRKRIGIAIVILVENGPADSMVYLGGRVRRDVGEWMVHEC